MNPIGSINPINPRDPTVAFYYEIPDKFGHGLPGLIRAAHEVPGYVRAGRPASIRSHRWTRPWHVRPLLHRARHRPVTHAMYRGERRAGHRRAPRVVFTAAFVIVTGVFLGLRALSDHGPGRAEAEITDGSIVPAQTELPIRPSRVPWSRSPSRTPAPAEATKSAMVSATPSTATVTRVTSTTSTPTTTASSASASSSASGSTSAAVFTIEAEADGNDRPAQMSVREVESASGGRAVSGVGDGRSMAFIGFALPTGGDYRVTIAYLSSGPLRCYLGNGQFWAPIEFPSSGGAGSVATVTVIMTLESGRNTVEAGNTPGRWCPDLDRITVAPTDHPSSATS
jgi:hypothetical protein